MVTIDTINCIKIFYVHKDRLYENSAQAIHIKELINNFPIFVNTFCFGPGPDTNIKNYIKIPMITDARIFSFILYELTELIYLLYFVMILKPDLLLIRYLPSISIIFLSKLFNIPLVLEINGLVAAEAILEDKNIIIRKIMQFIDNLNFKYSKKIIVVSKGIKDGILMIHDIDPNKFIIIPNGVNTERFTTLSTEHCRKNLNFDLNFNYIGFIGSFTPWHGLEYLIKSVPFVLEQMPNTKFVLIGDGKRKNSIRELVSELNLDNSFIFLPIISHNEMPMYINVFDVCVILKRKDIPGSPLKLREYMACGKPVIATQSDDFAILDENLAGFLVDPEDPKELSDTIIKLLQNKNICQIMGQNGRDCAIKYYSWNKIALSVAFACYDLIQSK